MKTSSNLIVFDLFGVVFNKGLESSIDRLVAALDRPERDVEQAYRKWERLFDLGKVDENQFWDNINADLGTEINPHVLSNIVIAAYKPNSNTIQLARFLRRKHKVVVYSNYRREWFDRLDDMFDIAVNFDDIVISSDTGLLKPDIDVFTYLSDEYETNIEGLIIVDDEQANVDGAEKAGGKGLLFKNVFEAEVNIRTLLGATMPDYDYFYSGVLLKTRQGALILQRRDNSMRIANAGRLSVFGGRRKRNESAVGCAIRELKEETGILREEGDFTLLKEYGAPDEKGRWVHCSYYEVEAELNEVDLKEGQGVEVWYPEQALKQNDLTEVPQVLIESVYDKRP